MKLSLSLVLCLLSVYSLHAQSLSLFNLDATTFPTLKAKFYAFDATGKLQRPLASDIILSENGKPRPIVSVTCPPPAAPDVLSSVLVIDISGSMHEGNGTTKRMNLAQAAASAWVNALPPGNECAVTSFDDKNYVNQDFTIDHPKLLSAINSLSPQGGTNYDNAFLAPKTGGLVLSKNAKYRKILVFLTDGQATGNEAAIIAEANRQNCIIFCVAVGMPAPDILKNIATKTGGKYFEHVTTSQEAQGIYAQILAIAQGNQPCEITWQSTDPCETGDVTVQAQWQAQTSTGKYTIAPTKKGSVKVIPTVISFGRRLPGTTNDTTITLRAANADMTVTGVSKTFGTADFTVVNTNFPLRIPQNTSATITLRFAPSDSSSQYASFSISTNTCPAFCSAYGGFPGVKMKIPTLQLTSPNGGEFFVVGSDTLITWQGVAPTDTVSLYYSTDNAATWNLLTSAATGLRYTWKNIPRPTSAQCLVKVVQTGGRVGQVIDWERAYGGSKVDIARSVDQTSDGGYLVAGYTASSDGDVNTFTGGDDYWILKLSSSGQIEKSYVYQGSKSDNAKCARQTFDGGYIVVGYSQSNDNNVPGNKGKTDYWIVKFRVDGGIEWKKTLGGKNEDYAESIQQTADSGYIVCGFTSSVDGDITENKGGFDYWVIKLSKTGVVEWQKTYGGEGDDQAFSIVQTTDGGYAIAGQTASLTGDVTGTKGSSDAWIVKLATDGTIEWQKSFGGSVADNTNSIEQTTDGGYIVAGNTSSNDGDVTGAKGANDYWVLKLTAQGNLDWQKTYGGSSIDIANSIQQTSDGGYVVAGQSSSNDGDITSPKGSSDFWIVKLTKTGAISWQKSLGGKGSDIANSIRQTFDGSYIIAGATSSNDGDVTGNQPGYSYWVVKLDTEGKPLQQDSSDAVFSIVAPQPLSKNIDMLQCLVGKDKDSVIQATVQNPGSYPFRVDKITFTGTNATEFSMLSGAPPFVVPPGGSQSIEIRFTPSTTGLRQAQMLIYTQADTLRQTIVGEGIAPKLGIINSIIDFGYVEVNTPKDTLQVVAIQNIGTAPLTITSTRHASPNDKDFTTLNGGGAFTLAVGEKRPVDVQFLPKDYGTTSGRLLFDYDGVGSPATVQLIGTGVNRDTARTTVSVQDITAHAGDKVVLTLKLQKKSGMELLGAPTTWKARLLYNASILYNEQSSSNCPGISDNCALDISGVYNPQTDELITIPCVATLGATDNSTIIIDDFTWTNSGIYTEVEKQNGSIRLSGVCEDGGVRLFIPAKNSTSLTTRPNPVQDQLQIHYGLREPLTITLELLNMTGQVVQTIMSTQVHPAGQFTVTSDIGLLGNGVYQLRMRTNKETLSTRVDIVK
jgi:hypothetical protein